MSFGRAGSISGNEAFYYDSNYKIVALTAPRIHRCASCHQNLRPRKSGFQGDTVYAFRYWRAKNTEVAERLRNTKNSVAPKYLYLCTNCGGIYNKLIEFGIGANLGDNMEALLAGFNLAHAPAGFYLNLDSV